jgi:hypothetical protein
MGCASAVMLGKEDEHWYYYTSKSLFIFHSEGYSSLNSVNILYPITKFLFRVVLRAVWVQYL